MPPDPSEGFIEATTGSEGQTLYRNTFSPDCRSEWIDLDKFLYGLKFGVFHFDMDLPQGLLDEYHEWEDKVLAERRKLEGQKDAP